MEEQRTASVSSTVVALRGERHLIDAQRPNAILVEHEAFRYSHQPDHVQATPVTTILLASVECPLRCVMCDLWKHTLPQRTPPGSIPEQIRQAIEYTRRIHAQEPQGTLKLYNSSNFFDDRATPRQDENEILRLCEPFDRIVVENHPRIGANRLFSFAKRLDGKLEVAVGLESIAPRMLARLNKQLTRDQFFEHANRLRDSGIDLRVFLIHGLPWLGPREQLAWTKTSVRYAVRSGARHISVIPCRGGNGFMDRLANQGLFRPPSLDELTDPFQWALTQDWNAGSVQHNNMASSAPIITVDLWDLERLHHCASCFAEEKLRLERMNLTQRPEPRTPCSCRRAEPAI